MQLQHFNNVKSYTVKECIMFHAGFRLAAVSVCVQMLEVIPGSEPSIIGGLVNRESHPWALKRSLDAYGELQVPITSNFSSSKVDIDLLLMCCRLV